MIVLLFSQIVATAQKQYDAVVLINKTQATVDKNEKLTIRYFREIMINNRNGDKYAHITISYPAGQKPKNLEAYILNKKGKKVRKLKNKNITTLQNVSNDAFHEDRNEMSFYLEPDDYPYVLVYSYEREMNEFFDISFTPVVNRLIPTEKSIFTVDIPKSYPVRFESQYMDTVKVDTTEKHVHFMFTSHYRDIIEKEPLMPPMSTLIPHALIVPYVFNYDTHHSQKTWKNLGQWQYNMLQGLNDLPPQEENKIHSLISGIKDTTQIIRVLYHYLQDETRYVNVAIKKGRLKPYDAEYVSRNKYGDCKALTNYFKSILNAVGIPSYYTNVNAGDPIERIDTSISTIQFNHIILYIPRNDTHSIWLDCTSKNAFGYLGTFTQDRYALVVARNNSRLVHTPALRPVDVLTTRKINIVYKPSGRAYADFDNTYRGEMYERLLGLSKLLSGNSKKELMRDFMSNMIMDNYAIKQENRDSADIHLQYQAHSDKIYVKYGNDMLVKNIPLPIPDLNKPDDRKYPVQLDFPIYRKDTIRYSIPSDYKISAFKKNTTLVSHFGKYTVRVTHSDNALVVTKSMLILPGVYSVKQYPDLYQFLKAIDKNERKINLVLTKKNP